METRIIICMLSIVLLAACGKEELLSLPGQRISGNWTEVEPQGIAQFEGSTYTALLLNEDNSYRLTYRFWTDIMDPSDPCHGIHDFYSKGSYTITSDSIFLDGCYTEAAFAGCFGKCGGDSKFLARYAYDLTPDSLILDPRSDVITRRAMIIR